MVKHTQTIHRLLPTNCLRVFDHILGLALKGLRLTHFRPIPGVSMKSSGNRRAFCFQGILKKNFGLIALSKSMFTIYKRDTRVISGLLFLLGLSHNLLLSFLLTLSKCRSHSSISLRNFEEVFASIIRKIKILF